MKLWLKVVLVLVVLLVLGLYALGTLVMRGYIPDTLVKREGELSQHERAVIAELFPLEKGEAIMYYYPLGLWSHREHAQLITNQRLMLAMEFDGLRWRQSMAFDQVASMEYFLSQSWLDDSAIFLRARDAQGLLNHWESLEENEASAVLDEALMADWPEDFSEAEEHFYDEDEDAPPGQLMIVLSRERGRDQEVVDYLREQLRSHGAEVRQVSEWPLEFLYEYVPELDE